jgi:hypothetical protein
MPATSMRIVMPLRVMIISLSSSSATTASTMFPGLSIHRHRHSHHVARLDVDHVDDGRAHRRPARLRYWA